MAHVEHFKPAHAVLGVAPNATPAEIKRAYRHLARKFHPDVSDEPEAEERFKQLQIAYRALRGRANDSSSFGTDKPRRSTSTTAQNEAERRARAFDEEVVARITIEQAAQGAEIDIDLQGKPVRIRIPAGVANGERLCVRGLLAEGAGDLYIVIELRRHRLFRTVGDDLYMKLPIAPWEAVLGAILDIPTPHGSMQVTLQPGTGTGQKLRLSGRGLARLGSDGEVALGDLYCVLRVMTPSSVGEREHALYRELAELSRFHPRARLEH